MLSWQLQCYEYFAHKGIVGRRIREAKLLRLDSFEEIAKHRLVLKCGTGSAGLQRPERLG